MPGVMPQAMILRSANARLRGTPDPFPEIAEGFKNPDGSPAFPPAVNQPRPAGKTPLVSRAPASTAAPAAKAGRVPSGKRARKHNVRRGTRRGR